MFNNPQINYRHSGACVSQSANPQNAAIIKLEEVKNAVGKYVSVLGKVYSGKDIGSMVLVNLGAPFPNQLLTIALKGPAKDLGNQMDNKIVTVEGEVIDYKGRPKMIVTDTSKIKF